MRKREEVIKEFIEFTGWKRAAVPNNKEYASLHNPKLQLEVLLDIRELLVELTKKP